MKQISVFGLCLGLLSGCGGGDDDGGDETVAGVCVRADTQGDFCIAYVGVPTANADAVASGCSGDWGGTWTVDGSCPTGKTSVGTCTLGSETNGGATSAVMTVYEPTTAETGENDLCGSDGTWQGI